MGGNQLPRRHLHRSRRGASHGRLCARSPRYIQPALDPRARPAEEQKWHADLAVAEVVEHTGVPLQSMGVGWGRYFLCAGRAFNRRGIITHSAFARSLPSSRFRLGNNLECQKFSSPAGPDTEQSMTTLQAIAFGAMLAWTPSLIIMAGLLWDVHEIEGVD